CRSAHAHPNLRSMRNFLQRYRCPRLRSRLVGRRNASRQGRPTTSRGNPDFHQLVSAKRRRPCTPESLPSGGSAMFAKLHYKSLAGCLALLLAGVGTAAWAADVRPNVDMGLAASSQPVHVTLILKLRHEAALEDYIRQTITPGSAHYRQFLGTAEFASQYGASDADIARVQAFLRQQGLSSTVLASHLAIETSATPAQLGAIFQAPIHEYVSARSGRRFHRPATAPRMPAALAGSVIFVSGLSNERQFLSHRINLPQLPATAQRSFTLKALAKTPGGNPTATGIPGDYTVGDVANFYNINPLYQHGINGKGSTVAIVTLSNFYPSDAQTYWSDIG